MTITAERLAPRPDVIARLVEEMAEQPFELTLEDERFLRENFGTIRR